MEAAERENETTQKSYLKERKVGELWALTTNAALSNEQITLHRPRARMILA